MDTYINKIPAEGALFDKDSLVSYSNPIMISGNQDQNDHLICVSGIEDQQGPQISSTMEETLNFIIPPREWEENGFRWRQTVSSELASREDVIKLWKQLEMRLQQKEARATGICPVRRLLMTQCFDEIIRQVSVDCNDRGLLLLRARDEMKKAIDAYRTVFESSVSFSLRKAAEADQQMSAMAKLIACEEEHNLSLQRELAEVKSTFSQVKRDLCSQQNIERNINAEELEFLKKTNQQLKAQYEGIVITKN